MQATLIVIDMQNDFVTGALGTDEARAIVPAVKACIDSAQAEGRTVLFTQDTHADDYLHTSEGEHLPIPHCVKGTEGWEIVPQLAPDAAIRLEKPTFGCLALVERLAKVADAGGANLDVALCGVCTDICVVSNALLLRAHFPEATLRLYPQACAGTTPAMHEAALQVMRSCQIDIA